MFEIIIESFNIRLILVVAKHENVQKAMFQR